MITYIEHVPRLEDNSYLSITTAANSYRSTRPTYSALAANPAGQVTATITYGGYSETAYDQAGTTDNNVNYTASAVNGRTVTANVYNPAFASTTASGSTSLERNVRGNGPPTSAGRTEHYSYDEFESTLADLYAPGWPGYDPPLRNGVTYTRTARIRETRERQTVKIASNRYGVYNYTTYFYSSSYTRSPDYVWFSTAFAGASGSTLTSYTDSRSHSGLYDNLIFTSTTATSLVNTTQTGSSGFLYVTTGPNGFITSSSSFPWILPFSTSIAIITQTIQEFDYAPVNQALVITSAYNWLIGDCAFALSAPQISGQISSRIALSEMSQVTGSTIPEITSVKTSNIVFLQKKSDEISGSFMTPQTDYTTVQAVTVTWVAGQEGTSYYFSKGSVLTQTPDYEYFVWEPTTTTFVGNITTTLEPIEEFGNTITTTGAIYSTVLVSSYSTLLARQGVLTYPVSVPSTITSSAKYYLPYVTTGTGSSSGNPDGQASWTNLIGITQAVESTDTSTFFKLQHPRYVSEGPLSGVELSPVGVLSAISVVPDNLHIASALYVPESAEKTDLLLARYGLTEDVLSYDILDFTSYNPIWYLKPEFQPVDYGGRPRLVAQDFNFPLFLTPASHLSYSVVSYTEGVNQASYTISYLPGSSYKFSSLTPGGSLGTGTFKYIFASQASTMLSASAGYFYSPFTAVGPRPNIFSQKNTTFLDPHTYGSIPAGMKTGQVAHSSMAREIIFTSWNGALSTSAVRTRSSILSGEQTVSLIVTNSCAESFYPVSAGGGFPVFAMARTDSTGSYAPFFSPFAFALNFPRE